MRTDRPDDDCERPGAANAPGVLGADATPDTGRDRDLTGKNADQEAGTGDAARVARNLEYRATVAAVDRAYAIDQGYAQVKEIEEKAVTPVMRRIEAEDPAKEETHWAYERLRSLPQDDEQVRDLHAYQREVTSKVPIPPGAPGIPDYP